MERPTIDGGANVVKILVREQKERRGVGLQSPNMTVRNIRRYRKTRDTL
jgi:hypothetical protein